MKSPGPDSWMLWSKKMSMFVEKKARVPSARLTQYKAQPPVSTNALCAQKRVNTYWLNTWSPQCRYTSCKFETIRKMHRGQPARAHTCSVGSLTLHNKTHIKPTVREGLGQHTLIRAALVNIARVDSDRRVVGTTTRSGSGGVSLPENVSLFGCECS